MSGFLPQFFLGGIQVGFVIALMPIWDTTGISLFLRAALPPCHFFFFSPNFHESKKSSKALGLELGPLAAPRQHELRYRARRSTMVTVKAAAVILFCVKSPVVDAFSASPAAKGIRVDRRGRQLYSNGTWWRVGEASRWRGTETSGIVHPRMSTAMPIAGYYKYRSELRAKAPGFWGLYSDVLARRPIVTKSLTSGVISGFANIVEQALGETAFSTTEWTAFTLVGTLFTGAALHHWFSFLERVSQSEILTSRVNKWGVILAQVGLDQTLGGAIMTIGYFTFHTLFSAALAGQVFPLPTLWSSIQKKVASKFWMVMVKSLMLWPWVGFINFAFVPVDLRVLVNNVVAIFWGYHMSKWCK